MHSNFPVYEMLRNGKLSVEGVERLNPGKWKYPELTKQKEVSALMQSFNGGGGGGVYITCCCTVLRVSFQIKLKFINLKEICWAKHEYMNMQPPPQINILATAVY